MTIATRITCPSCHTPLKEARGIRIGKKLVCPTCRTAFTIRPEDAEQVEGAGDVDFRRLRIVLAGALLYLLVGAALAAYCFTHNHPSEQAAEAESGTEGTVGDDETGTTTTPPKVPPPPPRQGAVNAAQQRKINDAIAAGVWFLKDQVQPNGSWEPGGSVGFPALPGLTLLECGIPGNDPLIQKAAGLVRSEAVQVGRDAHGTYQLALAILFLDRLGVCEDDDLIRYLALCLIVGQHPIDGEKRVAEASLHE
jgi:hypothetical protein